MNQLLIYNIIEMLSIMNLYYESVSPSSDLIYVHLHLFTYVPTQSQCTSAPVMHALCARTRIPIRDQGTSSTGATPGLAPLLLQPVPWDLVTTASSQFNVLKERKSTITVNGRIQHWTTWTTKLPV